MRLYNTHPDQGFLRVHNSARVIFQPQKGEWKVIKRSVPQGRKMNKPRVSYVLERVSDRKCRNWVEVPDDLGKSILTGDMSSLNAEGKIDTFHHGGFIKEMKDLEEQLEHELSEKEAAIQAKKARVAEIEAELERKQRLLDEMNLKGKAPAATAPAFTPDDSKEQKAKK